MAEMREASWASRRVVRLGQLIHQGDDLDLGEVGVRAQGRADLQQRVGLLNGAAGALGKDLLGIGDDLQLGRAVRDGLLVVRGGLHAVAVGRLERLLRVRQVLLGDHEVALSGGLGLLRGGLGALLLVHLLGVRGDGVLQGLLHHVEVVLGLGLSLAEVRQLALGLLHVLKDVHDAAALGLVDLRGRRAHLLVLSVVGGGLTGLHEGDKLLLVLAGDGGELLGGHLEVALGDRKSVV